MIRKPKYLNNITDLRKNLKNKYKRPETIEKKVDQYKLKNSLYKSQQNQVKTIKQKQSKLYKKTLSQTKGKSKQQIKNLWNTYNTKKEEIKETYETKSIFNTITKQKTNYKFNKHQTNKNGFENHYTLSGNIDEALKNLVSEEITSQINKPKFIVITLEGKSDYQIKNNLPSAFYSDSFTTELFVEAVEDPETLIEEIVIQNMTSTVSGEGFKVESVHLRLIYENN